ncbi:aminotransferase class III-fold pyridoxal phosphate-dependent enzyme [Chromobacterium haemolyticum]|uniref:aminotransferase class III-fold pyridoxal phosphate-dependent enzyme n=1 Tax=Chromobacterium haemolyticum TaxID=394935 RepID=UPI0029529D4E|nr:aminotransferase class III-fold pyridoxal phosphate-dependent enzyme [Chromobacterium haemolyticum]WON84002.1 aminotransferase class III-fold pyridoxal phosphate-dependent enzyme [Chromobacterium haemolyticum]
MTSTANRHPTGHLLYPFANASHIAAHPPLRIDRASGCHVFDQAGKRYLDGQGGLWNVNVGHDHPEIKEAITQQLNQLGFIRFLAAPPRSRPWRWLSVYAG